MCFVRGMSGSDHRPLPPADLMAAQARAAEAEARASAAEAMVAQLKLLIEKLKRELYGRRSERKAALIEQLLARREYADNWARKWSDLLRVKSEFPINLWPNATQAYYQWIWACMRDNVPYDKFVRALITSSGSNFRVPPVNFYRALQSRKPKDMAQAVALTFMGSRMWETARHTCVPTTWVRR